MTKDVALYQWFQSFGIPFYPTTELPEKPIFPYGTYTPIFGYLGDEVYPTVNIYDLTDSERLINKTAENFGKVIGMGGITITCDEGAMWIKRGNPFIQAIDDPDNSNVKRRLIQIAIEFLTTD